MRKIVWLIAGLLVIFSLFSCTQRSTNEKILVKLDVNLSEVTQLKGFEPRLTGYESEIDRMYLTVKNNSNQTVYATETTNKQNPSFSFELPGPGSYTFYVEGKRSDGTKVFYGSKVQEVTHGSNNIVIYAVLVNGTLSVRVEIDEIVWERYNVETASLEFKKDWESYWTTKNLTISGTSTTLEEQLYPSMYTVRFKIKLNAKHATITPPTWDNLFNPEEITAFVEPDRTIPAKFKIVFDSQKQEPRVIVTVEQISLPYIPEVTDLTAVWDQTSEKLSISWSYTSQNATFYIYKQLLNESGGKVYKLAGSTTEKVYTINGFTEDDYNKISGIAINVIVGEKESGLKVLPKESIQVIPLKVPEPPDVLVGEYDEDYSRSLTLKWSPVGGKGVKYKVYKKLSHNNDYMLVQDNIIETKITMILETTEWERLEKFAVSAYNTSGESVKREISKSEITLADFAGGSGTVDDPYLIGNARHLANVGKPKYVKMRKYFKLIEDIDLKDIYWTPIGIYGGEYNSFNGVLDGNGRKILNLRVTSFGLFYSINGGTVRNITIENAHVSSTDYSGVLTGLSIGATIMNIIVKNSNVSGFYAGGGLIADDSESIVEKCAVLNSSISARSAGGLIGRAYGYLRIKQSFADNVTVVARNDYMQGVGGLIGEIKNPNNSVIEDCYATGTIEATYTTINIGGFIGRIMMEYDEAKLSIARCFSAVAPSVTGNSNWKAFVGVISDTSKVLGESNYFDKEVAMTTYGSEKFDLQTGKTTAQMKQRATFFGWDFTNIWTINEGIDYPRLRWAQ